MKGLISQLQEQEGFSESEILTADIAPAAQITRFSQRNNAD